MFKDGLPVSLLTTSLSYIEMLKWDKHAKGNLCSALKKRKYPKAPIISWISFVPTGLFLKSAKAITLSTDQFPLCERAHNGQFLNIGWRGLRYSEEPCISKKNIEKVKKYSLQRGKQVEPIWKNGIYATQNSVETCSIESKFYVRQSSLCQNFLCCVKFSNRSRVGLSTIWIKLSFFSNLKRKDKLFVIPG